MITRIFFCGLVLCPLALIGQTLRGTIAGRVADEREQAIPRATITLTEKATGRERTTSSGPGGDFVFALLAPSSYVLKVSADGRHPFSRDIELLVDQEVRLQATLVAATAPPTQVEVTSARALLRLENAALGTTIDNRLVQGLPLDGRNFLELILLVPGAAPAAQGSAGSVRGDFAFHVNGSREDANQFLLDGVYNGDPKLNTFGFVAAVDAIREFEVATNAYDASFGRNAGGQVNVITKSGGNQIHGTAYEFFRDGAMDARNFFAPSGDAPEYRRNQFGVSMGGPVRPNRTFFFGDYEGRRVREGITRVTNVPTAAERTGDFSQSGLPFLIDPFTQMPFPGSRIPQARIHPIGAAIAALYPLPNRNIPRQNFVSSPALTDRNDQFDARVDHHLGAASDLAVRYSFADRDFFEPFAGVALSAVPGFGNDVPRRSHNLMISETHAIRPSLLNEFRAALSRVSAAVLQQGREADLNRKVGLPVISTRARDAGLTFLSLPGYSPLGDESTNPQQSTTNTFQLLDHATAASGRGLWKFGFEYRRLQQNAFRDVQSRGFINFVGFTGNPLAEMLQGLPAFSGVARLDNPQYLRSSSYNAFVNRSWRVTPGLTLNFGARYEYNSPPVDRFDRANVYDPASGRLAAVGKNGFPRGGYVPDRNNIAPRFGFAYSPFGTGRIVLRGGYGFYYDQSALAPGEGLYFSAPYFDFRAFFALQQSPLLLHDPFPANFPIPIPPSATAFQRDLRTPYVQHWNVNVQRAIGGASVLEAGYAGSKGTKLISARDFNQAGPSAAPINPRPNFFFGDINILESRANSNYHALQARFERRFSRGFSTLASYSWSKAIDDASGFFPSAGDPNYPQDSNNTRADRARSNFDVRQRLSFSYAWDLPFGRGRLLGGWQAFGVWSFQTGRPFTVALLPDTDNSGTGRTALGFGNNDRPNLLRDPKLSSPTPERWFDTSAFAISRRGTFGNSGRNIVDGPGLQSVNASLLKNVAFTEAVSLQLRFEAFNLFNHANFDLPDLYLESPTFGRISSAGSPRHLQLGVKLIF